MVTYKPKEIHILITAQSQKKNNMKKKDIRIPPKWKKSSITKFKTMEMAKMLETHTNTCTCVCNFENLVFKMISDLKEDSNKQIM